MYIKKSICNKKQKCKKQDCKDKIPTLKGKVEKVILGCGPPPSLECYQKCVECNKECSCEKPPESGNGGGNENKPGNPFGNGGGRGGGNGNKEDNPYGSGGGSWRVPGTGQNRSFDESEKPYYVDENTGQRYRQNGSGWQLQQPMPPQSSGSGSSSVKTNNSKDTLAVLLGLKAAGCDVESMCPGINLQALEEAGTGYPGGFVPLGMDTDAFVSDSYSMSLGNGIPNPLNTEGFVHNQILMGPCGRLWVYKAAGTNSNPSSVGVFKECQLRPVDFSTGIDESSVSNYNPLNGTVGSGVEGGAEGSYVTSGQSSVPNPRLSSSAINGQYYISSNGTVYKFIAPGYPGNPGVTGIWVPVSLRPQTFSSENVSLGITGQQSFLAYDNNVNIPTVTDNVSEGQMLVNKYGQVFIFKDGKWEYFQFTPPNFSPECNYNPGATGTTNGIENCDCCCEVDLSTQHPQNYIVSGFCNPTTFEGANNGQIYRNNRTGNEFMYDEKTNSWNPFGSGGGHGGAKGTTTTSSTPPDQTEPPFFGSGSGNGGWFPGKPLDGSADGSINVNKEDGSINVLKDNIWQDTGIKINNYSNLLQGISKPEFNGDIDIPSLNDGDLYLDESTGIFYKYDKPNNKWNETSFTSITNTSKTNYGSQPHSGNIYAYSQATGNSNVKEGDISIDDTTGEVREYRNGSWVPSGYSLDISKGMKIEYGPPPLTTNGYAEGSYYIDKLSGEVYQVSGGKWINAGYSLYNDCCEKYNKRYNNGIFYTSATEGTPNDVGIRGSEGDITITIDSSTGDGVFYKFTDGTWVKTGTSIDLIYDGPQLTNLRTSSLPPISSNDVSLDGTYHLDINTGILYRYDGISEKWLKVRMGSTNKNVSKDSGVYTGTIVQYTGPSMSGTEGDIAIDPSTRFVYEYRNSRWLNAGYRLDTNTTGTLQYLVGVGIPTAPATNEDTVYIDKITGNVYYYTSLDGWLYKGFSIYPYDNAFVGASGSVTIQ